MKKVSLLPSEVAATLSPSMQREMSEIVYGRRKSRRPPAHRGQYRSTNPKLRHESTKLHYILSGGEESVYQFAGKDNEDHFASAGGMLLRDDADDGNAFDAVYNEKFVHKDTESHFKDFGMTLVDDSDRGNAFDRVYNTAHEHKDTEDHFQSLGGMVLGDDADGTAEAEARAALRAESYRKAEAAARARLQNYQSMKRMGNEQLDSASHFEAPGSMLLGDAADEGNAFDRVYDSRHEDKDTADHFKEGGMTLADDADGGNVFDRVYDSRHEHKDTEDHFQGAQMLMEQGGSCANMLDPMRPDNAAVAKAELAPPFRPKFLHYGKHQQRSAAMQAELDAIVTSARGSPEMKGSPGGDGAKAATGFVAPMGSTGLQAVEATEGSSTALEHGATGRRGADGGGRITALPESQKKFAWGSERIAHELVCKFDQFTRRQEDHMRKLLWTFGTDPYFENAGEGDGHRRSGITVTPANFDRVCDRFGLVCSLEHANEIFERHNLPKDGCNMYELASKFLGSNVDTAHLVRNHRKKVLGETLVEKPRTPIPKRVPHKLARLPAEAWDAHKARKSPSKSPGSASPAAPLSPLTGAAAAAPASAARRASPPPALAPLTPPPAVATSPPRSPGELGTTFAAIPRADSPRAEAPLLGSLQASRATATAGGGASTARHGRSPLW